MKKWQKILIICVLCVSLALALGGFATLGILNYNTNVGSKVEVLYDAQHVYAQVDAAEGYKGYRFKFSSGGDKFTYDSASNCVDLSKVDKISLGKKYKISACYLGEIEGSNSRYGEECEWIANAYLARPEIKIEGNELSWQRVDNADYYLVKYGKNSFRTQNTQVDLTTLVGGRFDIVVTANYDFQKHGETEQNAKYKNSASNVLVDKSIVHHFEQFSEVTLSDENGEKFLNIKGNEIISKIDVVVGDKTFQFSVEPAKDFKLSMKNIYKEGVSIGASPARVDDYNIYTGAVKYVGQA